MIRQRLKVLAGQFTVVVLALGLLEGLVRSQVLSELFVAAPTAT